MLQLEDKLLICDFMEIEYDETHEVEALEIITTLDMTVNPCIHFKSPLEIVDVDDTNFDNSWDWIIPVVKKISSLVDELTYVDKVGMEQRLNPYTYDIESIAKGCVEFIKRYFFIMKKY